MLAGLRISVGPWVLRANVEDELEFFAQVVSHGSRKAIRQPFQPWASSVVGAVPFWIARHRTGGTILAIGDGIAQVKGLPSAAMEEILIFDDGSRAVVFALEEDVISAILLAQDEKLTAGSVAYLSGRRLSIPVGDALLGRVIDPLGVPLDGGPVPDCTGRRDLEAYRRPSSSGNLSTSLSTQEARSSTP